jgi:hypothetical protein
MVKSTMEPATMFCASPVETEGGGCLYRVNYSVGSKSAPAVLAAGTEIPSDSVVYTCTAIGQTNHASESWITGSKQVIECVGVPGFGGQHIRA